MDLNRTLCNNYDLCTISNNTRLRTIVNKASICLEVSMQNDILFWFASNVRLESDILITLKLTPTESPIVALSLKRSEAAGRMKSISHLSITLKQDRG